MIAGKAHRPLFSFLAVVGMVVGLVLWPQAASAATPSPVSGGGSSFAQLEIDQWRADTSHAPYSLKLDYSAAGSTFGRTQYLGGQLDYGVSDIPFQPDEAGAVAGSSRKNFVYVPVSAGGVGFMYNLKGTNGVRITNLHLTSRDVCRAFTEDTIYWDDPSIVAANPGVPLPHDIIRPVVRSDGSGTSFVFSAYCITVAPDVWQAFISLVLKEAPDVASLQFTQGGPTSVWPPQYGHAGTAYASDGVANTVANQISGTDTITYNEAGFALERGFPNAFIQNAAGVFHTPDPAAVSVALAYASPRDDGTFTLNYNAPDPNAYFPSTYSYVIAQTNGFDPGKGLTLGTFLNYAVTAGQARAEPLGYARLSTVLVTEAIDHIQQIPGAPPRPTSLGGAPPPPQTTSGVGAGARPTGPAGSGAAAAANAAKGAAAKGGTGVIGAAGAGSTATTLAESAAGSTAGAGDGVTESADGTPRVNVKNLPTAVVTNKSDGASSSPVSNKESLWLFLLGFGVLGLGSIFGAGGTIASGRRQGRA